MAANEPGMVNFWDYFHDQASGKSTARNYSNDYQQNKGKLHDTGDRILPAKDGAYKTYSGSDDTSQTSHSGSGNFIIVPTNDLNVMDYANYKGIPFAIQSKNTNHIEYQLGTDNPKGAPKSTGNTPFSSIYVTLQPQRAKRRNGKPMNKKDGSPIYTTGRGGWHRFSESNMKWKGNSMIRFIKDINNTNDDRFAYRELANMVNNYGKETKFDPMDDHMNLPESSQGGDVKQTRGHQGIVNDRPTQNVRRHDATNPYQQANRLYGFLLNKSNVGAKALDYLHKQGLSDDYIQGNYFGYVPPTDDQNKPLNPLEWSYKQKESLQLGVASRLVSRDKNGDFKDRLSGLFTQPIIKYGKIVGMNGYDKNGNRHPTLKNERVARHPEKYTTNPLRNDYNDKNPDFKDPGKSHDSHDKKMAMRYLHQKRGLRTSTVNQLMNEGMIRTSPGIKKNMNAENDLLKTQSKVDYLNAHKEQLAKDPNYGKQKLHEELFSNNSHLQNRHLNREARGFPAYIEFPQKMPRNDKHLHAEDQETVGADRIQFNPNRDDFVPSDAKFDKNGQNIGGKGKRIVAHGIKNYGYNITCNADKASKQRKLFVFESPLDELSYIDIHSRYINASKVPCDFLSLSGSGSKTKTVGNYINHRLKGTDQHYNRITFGTDNDRAGQQFITDYTLAARKYMPKPEVDKLFRVAVPPTGKDWNDTMQSTQKNGYHYQFQDNKIYTMDEFKDKVVRDNTKRMSREGLADAYKINGIAKSSYQEFENKGENPEVDVKPKYIHGVRDAYDRMKDRDPKDAKLYNKFSHGIGRTLSPNEIDRSLKNILSQSQDLGRNVDNQMAFSDHEKEYRMKNQNNRHLFTKSQNKSASNPSHLNQSSSEQNTQQNAKDNHHSKDTRFIPKNMTGKQWAKEFRKTIHAKADQHHQDAKKFNHDFDQKQKQHQKALDDKKAQKARKNQRLAQQRNNGQSFH